MILPGSHLYNLILLAFGMLCWGIWANTFKSTSRWRFELYCFDFGIGAVLASLAVGLTLGSMGWDGFALFDDFRIAGKTQDALALGAGFVFNLGNMLILGALSIAGLTVAYMIGVGLMLTTGILITRFTSPSGNVTLLTAGVLLVVVSAAFLAISARMFSLARLMVLMREGKTKSTKKVVSVKGLVLAVIGGIIAGCCFPLIKKAGESEIGVGPYTLGLLFAFGILSSTILYNLFFLNLPVQGEPVEISAYFRGKAKSHWLGILGGALWYAGLVALLIVSHAEGANVVEAKTVRALMLAAPLVGALWGLFRWKEFNGAEGKVRTFLTVAVMLFVVGIVALSLATGYSIAG